MRVSKDRPELASLDKLGREIQAVLELVRPVDRERDESHDRYDGYFGAASEAYLHLKGGHDSGLRVMSHDRHWWLVDEDGGVIDLTLGAADRREVKANPNKSFPYERGRGAMFRSRYRKPLRRA
jgi:hypothetical protein